MNIITSMLINQVLGSFNRDSDGMPNTSEARAMEFKDCDTSFEAGFKMITLDQLKECYKHDIYCNSFSRPRKSSSESGKVSLTDVSREK